MAASKILKPPHVWAGKALVEMPGIQRWSIAQVRAMKNGTYDWKKHEEKRT